MRTIPENVVSLLKSRSMLGTDAPTARVVFPEIKMAAVDGVASVGEGSGGYRWFRDIIEHQGKIYIAAANNDILPKNGGLWEWDGNQSLTQVVGADPALVTEDLWLASDGADIFMLRSNGLSAHDNKLYKKSGNSWAEVCETPAYPDGGGGPGALPLVEMVFANGAFWALSNIYHSGEEWGGCLYTSNGGTWTKVCGTTGNQTYPGRLWFNEQDGCLYAFGRSDPQDAGSPVTIVRFDTGGGSNWEVVAEGLDVFRDNKGGDSTFAYFNGSIHAIDGDSGDIYRINEDGSVLKVSITRSEYLPLIQDAVVHNGILYLAPQAGGTGIALDYYNGIRLVQCSISQQYSVAIKHLFVFGGTGKLYGIGQAAYGYTPRLIEFQLTEGEATLQVEQISIQREEAADSQRLTFSLPNINPSDPTDAGYYTPYRSSNEFGKAINEWYCVLVPSRRVLAKLGYGSNLATVFTGELDDVTMSAQPRDYIISADCRDLACWLIDQQVKLVEEGVTKYYIKYPLPEGVAGYWITPGGTTKPDAADIVKDLCMRAGFPEEDVIVEATGISLAPVFEKTSYMDAINELCTVSGFEFFVDEDGKARFYFPTGREPSIKDELKVLQSEDWVNLQKEHLVSGSDRVTDAGSGIVYTREVDYQIDLEKGRIRRLAGGDIPDFGSVKISYVYAGWVFREGEDIFSLKFGMSRRNIYGTIRVAGKGKEGVATAPPAMWDSSRVQRDKVLFADNQHLETQEECNECAARLKQDMLPRYTCAEFVAVGNPWLQVGDNIMVVESSTTISEVYKILSISFDMSSDGFTMALKTFHVGYTPLTT